MKKENFSITCSDNVRLGGVLFIPDHPKAVVQFNGGTAVRKDFYFPFLEYLAGQGFICCAWDYRGSGDSAPEDLRNCDHYFRDYGLKDMPAIRDYLAGRFRGLPMLLVTHSVGGQQVGFIPDPGSFSGMLCFAVSTGYSRNMPFAFRLLTFFYFYIFTPVSILFTGYSRSRLISSMENLPRNVVLEWRSWCSKPTYFFDPSFYGKTVPKGNFDRIPYPVHTCICPG